MKHPILLKLDEETHARWTAAAREAGSKSLCDWIRDACQMALAPTLVCSEHSFGGVVRLRGGTHAAKLDVPGRPLSPRKASTRTRETIDAHIGSGREMQDVRAPSPAPGACDHGKKEGELCYKCDERFGYPRLA